MLSAVTDRLTNAIRTAEALLARHTTIEGLRQDLGPRLQKALTFYSVFFDGSLPDYQGPKTREEARAVKPFTAFDRSLPVRERALDCLRVVLNGKLSEEEKTFPRRCYIRPVPAKAIDGSAAFQWEHPYVTEADAEEVDMSIFSGTDEGPVVATEDEAWIEAYISKAFWCE